MHYILNQGLLNYQTAKNYEKFGNINQPWYTSIPYNLSLNPILKNAACYCTESDVQQKSKNQSLASFDFESVMDPCEVYCARSTSCLVEFVNGATIIQPSTQPCEWPDCSTKLLQAQTRSQASLTSSGSQERCQQEAVFRKMFMVGHSGRDRYYIMINQKKNQLWTLVHSLICPLI